MTHQAMNTSLHSEDAKGKAAMAYNSAEFASACPGYQITPKNFLMHLYALKLKGFL
jgi:hypothetical protein